MKLLIATHNPAKKKEIGEWLGQEIPNVEIITLDYLQIKEDPDETGKTFEENAILKAAFYAEKSGLPSIADDGGLQIDALGGAPGVMSKRWLGRAAPDQELINHTLAMMKEVPPHKRTARFTLVLCFYDPKTNKTLLETESVEGSIATRARDTWRPGFQYRAVFIVKKFGKYYDDLTPQEHATINHRYIAVKRLAKKIRSLYHDSR